MCAALVILPTSDFQEIYDGVWGYNELLTMASLSCVFFKFNHKAFILATVATAATTVAQFALRKNMTLQVCNCPQQSPTQGLG